VNSDRFTWISSAVSVAVPDEYAPLAPLTPAEEEGAEDLGCDGTDDDGGAPPYDDVVDADERSQRLLMLLTLEGVSIDEVTSPHLL